MCRRSRRTSGKRLSSKGNNKDKGSKAPVSEKKTGFVARRTFSRNPSVKELVILTLKVTTGSG